MKELRLLALVVGLAAGAVYLYSQFRRAPGIRDEYGLIRVTPPKSITVLAVPPVPPL